MKHLYVSYGMLGIKIYDFITILLQTINQLPPSRNTDGTNEGEWSASTVLTIPHIQKHSTHFTFIRVHPSNQCHPCSNHQALSLFTVHLSLFTVYLSLFTVYCSLFTVHCSLVTIHYSPCSIHMTIQVYNKNT